MTKDSRVRKALAHMHDGFCDALHQQGAAGAVEFFSQTLCPAP